MKTLTVVLLTITCCSTWAADLDKPYTPSRKEWLEMVVNQNAGDRIQVVVDSPRGIWVRRNIRADEQLSDNACVQALIAAAQLQIKIEPYQWAKDMPITASVYRLTTDKVPQSIWARPFPTDGSALENFEGCSNNCLTSRCSRPRQSGAACCGSSKTSGRLSSVVIGILLVLVKVDRASGERCQS